MIMLVGIVDAEGDHDLVEKGRVRQRRAAGPKIGGGMKHQLVPPGRKTVAFQQRPVDPAVIIRRHRQQRLPCRAVAATEVDAQAGGGRPAAVSSTCVVRRPIAARPFWLFKQANCPKSANYALKRQMNLTKLTATTSRFQLSRSHQHHAGHSLSHPAGLHDTGRFHGVLRRHLRTFALLPRRCGTGLGPEDASGAFRRPHAAWSMPRRMRGASRCFARTPNSPESWRGRRADGGIEIRTGRSRARPLLARRIRPLHRAERPLFGQVRPPFIIAVKARPRRHPDAFERRIGNDAASEFATAIEQVHRIALLRLEALCD